MAQITFFEETGCIDNIKQKQQLIEAGHTVSAIKITRYPWNREELYSFLKDLPLNAWFHNFNKLCATGKVDFKTLNETKALDILLRKPRWIRRPLLIIDQRKLAGFDEKKLHQLIGLKTQERQKLSFAISSIPIAKTNEKQKKVQPV